MNSGIVCPLAFPLWLLGCLHRRGRPLGQWAQRPTRDDHVDLRAQLALALSLGLKTELQGERDHAGTRFPTPPRRRAARQGAARGLGVVGGDLERVFRVKALVEEAPAGGGAGRTTTDRRGG